MTDEHVHLSPDSAFSRAVYKEIRPAIPRMQWPAERVAASFVAAGNGAYLEGTFEDFTAGYAKVAALKIRTAGFEMVMASPVAAMASAVFRVLRWRNIFLFAVLPLLFAIPLMASLEATAMRFATLLFAGDLLALIVSHGNLLLRRNALSAMRFTVEIPAPGMRIRVPLARTVRAPL